MIKKNNIWYNKKYFYELSERGFSKKDILSGIEVLKSEQITMSSITKEFEIKFAKKIGSKYAIMVNSGSSANLIATYAAGNPLRKNRFKPGDEVLVPILCWPTSVWPLVQFGLKPIFVDINKDNLNICEDSLLSKINKKTKSIMLVNVLGYSANLFKIKKIAKKHNLILLEDNCESLGSVYKKKYLGTFGDFASFSFFYSHQITSGEGGMVTCNTVEDYDLLFSLRSHGWFGGNRTYPRSSKNYNFYKNKYKNLDPRFIFSNIGFNVRPTDVQAAIGMSQFERLDSFIDIRNHNRDLIISALRKSKNWTGQFLFIENKNNFKPSLMLMPIILRDDLIHKKKKFISFLEEEGIETRPIIGGSFNNQPCYKLFKLDRHNDRIYPNAQKIQESGFAIGLHKHKISTKILNKLITTLLKIDLL